MLTFFYFTKRDVDVESEMGERKCRVGARAGVILTPRHIRGSVHGEAGL